MPRRACVRARTAPDAWRAARSHRVRARRCGRHRRRTWRSRTALGHRRAAARDETRGRCAQQFHRLFHFRHQHTDARAPRHLRRVRGLRAQAAHRDAHFDQRLDCLRCGRQCGGIESGEQAFGIVEMADEREQPHVERACMHGVDVIAVRVERFARVIERFLRSREIARGQRDFRLRDDTARTRHRLLRAEAARGAFYESLGAIEVTELRHRDTAHASAGASSRSATRLSGSPAASALAAAVISESIQVLASFPATLTTPVDDAPLSHRRNAGVRGERGRYHRRIALDAPDARPSDTRRLDPGRRCGRASAARPGCARRRRSSACGSR